MTEQMISQIVVVVMIAFGIMIMPLFFIAFDFWAGIRKAKIRGELITSDGWQRTVQKIARYYNMIFALALIDIMQIVSVWYLNNYGGWNIVLFPWFTFLGVSFIGAIETKSIMEPADEKEKKELKQVTHLAVELAKHKTEPDEIAKAVVKYLNKNSK